MKAPSYPCPASPLVGAEVDLISSTPPRRLLPVNRFPPQHHEPPSLPFPPRAADTFLPGWTISSHVAPAAYPRLYNPITHESHYNSPGHVENSRKIIMERARKTAQTLFHKKLRLESGGFDGVIVSTKDNEAIVLYNVVNRYRRQRQPSKVGHPYMTPLTLFAVHGNRFHKETWEPTFRFMIEHLDEIESPVFIDEIWSFEVANHGDSAIINRPFLGDLVDLNEFPRDVINFMINYLPDSVELNEELPYVLPHLPTRICDSRTQDGFGNRKVVGLGHSLGAFCIARATEELPCLWSSLILVDPIIFPPIPAGGLSSFSASLVALLASTVGRHSTWESREAALTFLKSAPFFASWDDQALKAFVDYGLIEADGKVSLKTTGFQEAVTFCNTHQLLQAWYLLNTIPAKIPIRWIMAENTSIMTGADRVAHMVWRRPQNSSNTRLSGAHHPVPQETPNLLGREIAGFLTKEYGASCLRTKL